MAGNDSVFQLRRELEQKVGEGVDGFPGNVSSFSMDTDEKSGTDNLMSDQLFDGGRLLTENERYCVRSLVPDLSSLFKRTGADGTCSFTQDRLQQHGAQQLKSEYYGFVDTRSQKALCADKDNLYIWDYNSKLRDTPFGKIPLHDENTVSSAVPICLLTCPVAIDNVSPLQVASAPCLDSHEIDSTADIENGLCTINRNNGHLQYYEDLNSVNNLYSKLSLNKAHSLDLKLRDKELVTKAINCEPAGIIVATSFGRLLFVSIRDSTGMTCVKLQKQLIKPQIGFLFSTFNSAKEIVSLKAGPIIGKGEILVYVATKGGDFQIWQISLFSSPFKRIDVNIYEHILESLQDLYPFAHGTLEILDSHPLFADTSSTHLVLSSISKGDQVYYILSTIVVDEASKSFNIFSTYKISTYFSSFDEENKPKLCIPTALSDSIKLYSSICILFKDAVVLTKVSSKLDSNYILRKKWEDVICFNSNLNIIGSGYSSNSIYIMAKEDDIIQVTINDKDEKDLEATSFTKSHIDQAVYFSNISTNPIEYNLPENIVLEKEEIESDLLESANEIFKSKGKYIPPMLNTVEQHLQMRINLYKNLLNFVKDNFNYKISPNTKLLLLEKYEIMNCASKLLQFQSMKEDLSKIWSRIITSYDQSLNLESLILHRLDVFPILFSNLLKELSITSINSGLINSKSTVIDLLISSLYDAVLEDGEKDIRYDKFQLDPLEIGEKRSWFLNYDILSSLNQLFFDYKFSLKDTNDYTNKQLLTLVKSLYYISWHAKVWYTSQTIIDSEKCNEINLVYNENHNNWIQVLCEHKLHEDALQLSEFYRDLKSLVEVLEELEFNEFKHLYAQYFEQFGEEFSSTLFKYYIDNNKLKSLFFNFPEQHDLLRKFLLSSSEYNNVAWIQEIFDENYHSASDILSSVLIENNNSDLTVDKTKLYLNIAKLSELADPMDINENKVVMIQAGIDTINFQKKLHYQLENKSPVICDIYQNSEFKVIFQNLINKIKKQQYISINEAIDIYTLMGGLDNFVDAVKLLSSLNNSIDYETKRALYTTIWRRCILSDKDWVHLDDLSESVLYKVLYQCFNDIVEKYDMLLPEYNALIDNSIVSFDYIKHIYGKYDVSIISVQDAISKEVHSIEQLGFNLIDKLKTIVGSANINTRSNVTINYETMTIA
ncbi:hypothetical protein TPHA_0J01420 [Tetrapisispora phaffii CBS 4417]|uniref:Nucleoporin Nup133/Nup155-like N-terminal domain-containing protein n=1 Tax=Tetrapisispora phaffii (strain ATCC 24235 / CBS 4417 / NBRC 1672 / NRRL Y-8282 / UCD 70-5) TaxID=1071381 RepID=G8BYM2_TETPH|nr:hypothetical protein TPHA_0J01420 [Tetrapisispora phaffii CBS 4417]CCE64964.1 hypothetical protein TPHA_0J01420 [Tetrapisispora phaffii CBS 4417]